MIPAASPILKATLHADEAVDVRLLHYPAGLTQPRHRHDEAQLSVLLAGSLREITRRGDVEALRSASGIKPSGQSHAAAFGPQGALMLSMTLAKDPASTRRAGEWAPTSAVVNALIGALLATDEAAGRAEMVDDLRALLAVPGPREPSRAERDAARRLKRALETEPEDGRIGGLARELGLHRAHLTRCFAEAYGLAPSLYRARVMAARALAMALRSDDSLAGVAAEAGFADQSHLARTCRRQVGVSLSRVRTLFGRATSVQAAGA